MNTQVATIDSADAIEAAELVAFVESWLAQADRSVNSNFERLAAPYTLPELRAVRSPSATFATAGRWSAQD